MLRLSKSFFFPGEASKYPMMASHSSAGSVGEVVCDSDIERRVPRTRPVIPKESIVRFSINVRAREYTTYVAEEEQNEERSVVVFVSLDWNSCLVTFLHGSGCSAAALTQNFKDKTD